MLLGGCILQLFLSPMSQNKHPWMFMRVLQTKGKVKGSPHAFPQDVIHTPGLLSTLSLSACVFCAPSLGRLLSSPSGVRRSRGFTRQLTLSRARPTEACEQKPLKCAATARCRPESPRIIDAEPGDAGQSHRKDPGRAERADLTANSV